MNQEQILKEIKNSGTQKVKLAITDMDGILRGKVINIKKFEGVAKGGLGFCDVVFGWDANDLCYENAGIEQTGWHTGYPDAHVKLDLSTFRKVPWDENIPFFLGDFWNKNGSPLDICPRQLLKKVKSKSIDMGFDPVFSQEFEWFNFRENSEDLNDRNFVDLNPITRGMFGYSILRASQNGEFFNELFDLLNLFNVPIEGIHTETGPGVYEAAIMYGDILESADRAVLFKSSAKEIAHRHGIIPTFMAKWDSQLPGCSGHVHQSLWRDGKNVFFDLNDENNMSETMKSYLAGMLHCLPHFLPMFAPTINSYKRLVEGMWAPTTLTWGIDNRTCALRVLPGSESATRIEHRVVGSDVNPYLAMAASLASGLYGIEKGLKLEIPETIGNGYTNSKHGTLPRNLFEAAERMEQSEIANQVFGESFVKHFCATRKWEWKQYAQAVTDWEIKRYFEVI